MTAKLKAAVAALSKKPVRFVINTHWHADHTGGNPALGSGGAVIVAHDNVRKRLAVDQTMTFGGQVRTDRGDAARGAAGRHLRRGRDAAPERRRRARDPRSARAHRR